MSVSYIPESIKCRLWGHAAGRCQYQGCNRPLWKDDVSQAAFNTAYIAHIVADKPDGPRGDPILSPQLSADISNLMLMCDVHHRQIDVAQVPEHPVSRLKAMKAEHESRIEMAGGIAPECRSEILLYGANIGEHIRLPSFGEAAAAMMPERFPARHHPTSLSLVNSWQQDHEPTYWNSEAENLRRGFDRDLRPRLRDSAPPHVSVFALAPQPLLMLLGHLLGDLQPADVFQLHREPASWAWLSEGEVQPLVVRRPDEHSGPPALVLSLSGTITVDRVTAVLGPNACIWTVTIACPNNDYLKRPEQLQEFRETARKLLDQIKVAHGQGVVLHVFPAAPVAICVELGRALMPKVDLPLRVYDAHKRRGDFAHALDLNTDGGGSR